MYFTEIELCNYGIYKGRHHIRLQNQNEGRNITLIGGMNGRGKTTILDAVFLCLYGRKSVEYIIGKKEAYARMLEDRMNKSAGAERTYIRLELVADEDGGSCLSIQRSWWRGGKKIETTLEVARDGAADEYLSQNWEYYVEELIPFGIAKFFFFDNEKISQIADDDAFDKVKDSIKSVMGVTTIESLSLHMAKIAKAKGDALKNLQNCQSESELEELDRQLEELKQAVGALKEKRDSLAPNFQRISAGIEAADQEFWRRGGNLGLNRDEIKREMERLKTAEEDNRLQALSLASSPMTPLCLCRELVVEAYEAAKRDEANRAKQNSGPIVSALYQGLVERCQKEFGGMPVFDSLKQVIDAQFQEYRPAAVKAPAIELGPMSMDLVEKMLHEGCGRAVSQTAQMKRQNEEIENRLLQLEVHLNSGADQAGAVELLKEMRDLEEQKGRCKAEMDKCDEEIHNLEVRRDAVQDRRAHAMMKIAAQADSRSDTARILQYAAITMDVMTEFTVRLQAQKVHQLEANITQCFCRLAQKQTVITSISIDPVTLNVTLRGYDGGVLMKEQLSAGEKQMFAISILWGLARSSGYQLPVIIDTPLARLDSAHRSNFISRYLPNASSQVIVLSTDEEVYGQYLEDIKDHVNACYTLVYHEDEKCSSIQPGYFGGGTR